MASFGINCWHYGRFRELQSENYNNYTSDIHNYNNYNSHSPLEKNFDDSDIVWKATNEGFVHKRVKKGLILHWVGWWFAWACRASENHHPTQCTINPISMSCECWNVILAWPLDKKLPNLWCVMLVLKCLPMAINTDDERSDVDLIIRLNHIKC